MDVPWDQEFNQMSRALLASNSAHSTGIGLTVMSGWENILKTCGKRENAYGVQNSVSVRS